MARPKSFDPEAVLDQAVELFRRRGYHGASLSLLVEHLGINRASLYDTYGDKEGLYLRALERYAAAWPVPDVRMSPRAADLVQAGLEATLQRCHQQKDARGCLLFKAAAEDGPDAAQDLAKAYAQGWEKWFRKALETGTRRKAAARRNAREDGRFLLGQAYALHGMSLMSTDRKGPKALIDTAVALVA
jgi:TetR/AcrR family transcriptional repressor of nem operon